MDRTQTKEKRIHSSELIPFSYYMSSIPDYNDHVPLHWHKEFELTYILKGCGEFICGTEKFISEEGDIILIPPNMLHSIYPYEDHEHKYDTIVFHADLLGTSKNDRSAVELIRPIASGKLCFHVRITKSHPAYFKLKECVEVIFDCAKQNTAQMDLLLKGELLRFFWFLQNNGDFYPNSHSKQDNLESIKLAIAYIENNYRENITIEMLADTVHLSKSYFMGSFKKAAGIGAIEYLTQFRINAVCERLCSTNENTADIAFDCGFQNLSNFNRQFKRIVGCTPSQYRKMNKRF